MPAGVAHSQYLRGLRAYDPKRLRNEVFQTYPTNGHMLLRTFMAPGVREVDSTDRWKYAISLSETDGNGGFQPAFGQDALVIGSPPVLCGGDLSTQSYNIETYDLSVRANQKVTAEVIYDDQKQARIEGLRGMGNALEPQLRRAPQTFSDARYWCGLEGWLPPSQTSGGVFTASADPSFGGIYTSLRDGTYSGSVYGVDRTNVSNLRFRSGTATRSSTNFTYADAETLFAQCMFHNFVPTPLQDEDGEVYDQSDLRLLFPQTQHNQLVFMANKGPDDLQGKIFRFDGSSFAEHKVVRVPELDNDATASIYGIQLKTWMWFKKPGFWMNRVGPLDVPLKHNTKYVMMDMHGFLVCTNPRSNFRNHGPF